MLIAHDWLLGWAGSERVLREIVCTLPQAEVVTAFADPQVLAEHFAGIRVHELWPGRVHGMRRWYQWLLPLQAAAFGTLATGRYDVVISSAHALAKATRPGRRGIHICYCHSPPRYLWDQYETYYAGSP